MSPGARDVIESPNRGRPPNTKAALDGRCSAPVAKTLRRPPSRRQQRPSSHPRGTPGPSAGDGPARRRTYPQTTPSVIDRSLRRPGSGCGAFGLLLAVLGELESQVEREAASSNAMHQEAPGSACSCDCGDTASVGHVKLRLRAVLPPGRSPPPRRCSSQAEGRVAAVRRRTGPAIPSGEHLRDSVVETRTVTSAARSTLPSVVERLRRSPSAT